MLRRRIENSRDADRKRISVDVRESCFDEDAFVLVGSTLFSEYDETQTAAVVSVIDFVVHACRNRGTAA